MAPRSKLMSATHCCTAVRLMSETATSPQRGSTWTFQALFTGRSAEGFRCDCLPSHAGPRPPTVALEAAASMNSPRSFDTSTVAANASASRLVLNPRLSVLRRLGVRYRTRYRRPAFVS